MTFIPVTLVFHKLNCILQIVQKKQVLCENKHLRNIVFLSPPLITLTVTHLSLLLSFLFPKTFFSKDKFSIVLEQICDVFQYHTLLPRFLTLSVTFNMRACNNFQISKE